MSVKAIWLLADEHRNLLDGSPCRRNNLLINKQQNPDKKAEASWKENPPPKLLPVIEYSEFPLIKAPRSRRPRG
jgi:hypothetical protein